MHRGGAHNLALSVEKVQKNIAMQRKSGRGGAAAGVASRLDVDLSERREASCMSGWYMNV